MSVLLIVILYVMAILELCLSRTLVIHLADCKCALSIGFDLSALIGFTIEYITLT